MEGNEEKSLENNDIKALLPNGIVELVAKLLQWQENITVLDLSNRKLKTLDNNAKLPPHLLHLNLSHNELCEVPNPVLNNNTLRTLDISSNRIKYFDDMPSFCHTIERLNLANNNLYGPPYWVWTERPKQLFKVKLNCNINITKSLTDDYFGELLQHKTLVTNIDLFNCKLGNCLSLLSTFPRAKIMKLGIGNYSHIASNFIEDLPPRGMLRCVEVETLDMCNTHIYNINSRINVFVHLIEINLSQNYISSLPNEFCNLVNLETCILSFNKLLYLPDDICKLNKLIHLCIDSNELCMIPESVCELPNLKILDLYDNHIYEVVDEIKNIEQLDLAQNYMDEPEDDDYKRSKERLRLSMPGRYDGRKHEVIKPDSEHSTELSDDEELLTFFDDSNNQGTSNQNYDLPSSPEDWDSDEYWIPQYYRRDTPSPHAPWMYFVKRKIDEGHFCPMDTHLVPVADRVRYEKLLNPPVEHESDGQFDDYSDDDS